MQIRGRPDRYQTHDSRNPGGVRVVTKACDCPQYCCSCHRRCGIDTVSIHNIWSNTWMLMVIPDPKSSAPTFGIIQCNRDCIDHPYQNTPMGINNTPGTKSRALNSGLPTPPLRCLSLACIWLLSVIILSSKIQKSMPSLRYHWLGHRSGLQGKNLSSTRGSSAPQYRTFLL